ncbi:hypothetical protein MU516_16945 [Paracoccus sp. YLB-12]|uniref:Lipoprotein n=1 Tax=Paracoccus maritimus TaxID=2933292 RepID=A0ABT2KF03_9RHOB|nr:hypothetical protein [Paracoccus sp. YLB-12]MCT4334544.1 hypothetical protein [Paracoccus sp. YLB-12]
MKRHILAIFGLAAVAACTGSMGYTATELTDRDREMQARAFRENLADPLGTQVEAVQVFAAPNGNRMICGKVNAKNAFGGYIGFQTFEVVTAGGYDYSKPGLRPIFATGATASLDCAGAGYSG